MKQLNKRQIDILEKIPTKEGVSSSDVFKTFNQKVSLITIKRDLDSLVLLKYLNRKGKGRSTVYEKTTVGVLFFPLDAFEYNKVDPDNRNGNSDFNFSLFEEFPKYLFSDEEKDTLDVATENYKKKIKDITPIVQSKELERFIIELSWKSSKIEGNTYTLLDTERLIKEGIPAEGNTAKETSMIINHKKAFSFIMDNFKSINDKGITLNFIEKVHELLTLDLGVARGVRTGLVGIIGTKYRPLDNKYQINEALESLCKKVNTMDDPYSRALTLLVGISYIQPFEDGNKRTSRLICNAILLAENCAPLSYRSVDENNYRESILVFYEKNSLIPMKKIFIEQYIFSTQNYLIKK
ncbi:MAG: Fic family protein [Candidatus Nomurabacteria bacterium]|nr:Fic family protein [Candidatus Nomurabacteria bacterium]